MISSAIVRRLGPLLIGLYHDDATAIEGDALIYIAAQQPARIRCVLSRQKIGAQEFGPDRICFSFFIVLAQVVAAHRHRKGEANDQGQQRQSRGQHRRS
jgi:hypothetical protein